MIRTSELRGFEGDVSPSRGSYKGVRDARNNERHVCERRVGEPAGTGPPFA